MSEFLEIFYDDDKEKKVYPKVVDLANKYVSKMSVSPEKSSRGSCDSEIRDEGDRQAP